MTISAVILDDDSDSRLVIAKWLKEYFPGIIQKGEGASVAEGLQLISAVRPDLILLDISFPDGTAFDLLERLPFNDFEVIFTTAYNTYAVNAFRMAAVDYLLKPVSISELTEAIGKFYNRVEQNYFAQHWKVLSFNSRQPVSYERKIAIATAEGYLFTHIKDIVRLESNSNYTHFFFSNTKKLVSSRTMGYYQEILPADRFCRIHHSHIVNIEYIDKYIRNGAGGIIVMRDGAELGVSQRKKEEVIKYLTGDDK